MEPQIPSSEMTTSASYNPMNISSITEQPQAQPFRTVQLQIPANTDSTSKKKEPIQRRGRRKSADLGNFQFHWKLEKNTTKEKKEKKNSNNVQFTEATGANNGMNSPASIRTKTATSDKRRRPTSMPNLGPNLETYKAAQYLTNFQLSQLSEKDRITVLAQAAKLTNNERILPALNAMIQKHENEVDEESIPKKRKIKKKTVTLPPLEQENENVSSEEDKLQMMNLSEGSPIMNPSTSMNRQPVIQSEDNKSCKTRDDSSLSKMSIANLVQ